MLVILNVRSKNGKAVTRRSESFESSEMLNLKDNQNTAGSPVLAGKSEFLLTFANKRDEVYTVDESVASINNMTAGSGNPVTSGAAATGWTALEYGDGVHNRTILTKDESLVQAVAGAALCFGVKAYDFPIGQLKCIAGTIKFTISAPAGTETPEVGLGTLVGDDSANATIGPAGATMEDVLDGTATSAVTSTGTVESYQFTAETGVLDGTAGALDLNLNCAGNWAQTEDLTISAITIDLTWELWGQFPA